MNFVCNCHIFGCRLLSWINLVLRAFLEPVLLHGAPVLVGRVIWNKIFVVILTLRW